MAFPAITAPAATETSYVSSRRRWWTVLLLVWALCAVYSATLLRRGWVPHDEGTIGQSAARVLAGQLPHRDFDDVYTGGLGCLNALAMRVFGESLLAPRIALFLCFLAWVPAVYSIASRFTSAVVAGFITLLAAAWSIPVYSSAAPSWYNLFLATFGLAALLRYLDTNSARWLFLAGLCGGISFVFKVSGLYFIASALLFFVFVEQDVHPPASGPGKRTLYSLLIIGGLIAFFAAVFAVVRKNLSAVAVVEFVVPAAALAFFCIWREMQGGRIEAPRRFSVLARMLLPFLAGAALPVLIYLIPYVLSGSLFSLINGVFILPARRFDFAARRPPGFGPARILATIALVTLLVAAYRSRGRSWTTRLGVAAVLLVVFVTARTHPTVFAAAWAPLALLVPLGALAGVLLLGNTAFSERNPPLRRRQLMLLLSVTVVCSLIQLPFAVGVYFCYAAPLVILALLALFSTAQQPSRFLLGSVLVFYLAFVVFLVTPGFVYVMGSYYQPDPQTQRLNLARAGGLRVDPAEAREYEQLIPMVQQHAGGSEFIYAGPDCPEVYFLSGKRNPTRTLFDFFDPPEGRTPRILATLDSRQVKVAAILLQPAFSPPMASDLLAALRERFPNAAKIGKFEVRWRP
ncbi:MAG TPA: glycosyltransferase family 39 protein [Terriglobales bacterium]|nr:glycosyltransferase family 39 protein [Terriglobales bacterium]